MRSTGRGAISTYFFIHEPPYLMIAEVCLMMMMIMMMIEVVVVCLILAMLSKAYLSFSHVAFIAITMSNQCNQHIINLVVITSTVMILLSISFIALLTHIHHNILTVTSTVILS